MSETAVSGEGRVELGYRSLFTVDRSLEPDVVPAALAQLNSWLRVHKQYDADAIREGEQVTIGQGATASLYRIDDRDGAVTVQVEVVEDRAENGTWTSKLLLHAPGRLDDPATVLLDIIGPIKPRAPHLARNLTGSLPAYDSFAQLSDRPRVVRLEDVDEVAEAVCDPHRRGLLFVAGSYTDIPFDSWYEYVEALLRETTGLAAAYVLKPEATDLFNKAMGATHGVRPGTVRTYLPEADPASETDALRHRILSTNRIVTDSSKRLAFMLRNRAQEQALTPELPRKISRLQRRLGEHVDQLLLRPALASVGAESSQALESDLTEPPVGAQPEPEPAVKSAPLTEDEETQRQQKAASGSLQLVAQSALALIRRVLGVANPGERDWRRITELALLGKQKTETSQQVEKQLNQLRDDLDYAESSRGEMQRRLDDEMTEHAVTAQEIVELQRRNEYLERLLRKTEAADEVYADYAQEPEQPPSDFEALIDAMRNLEFVEFTGDEDVILKLDEYDPLGRWAAKSWDVACALEDYAQASRDGRCTTNVEEYLKNPPHGCRTYTAGRHAQTESEDVQSNRKFRNARVLPVPPEVADDGYVEMFAHFKIAQSGLISPRLHYYDDTARSGKVFIGYLGPHLPTKRTN